MNENPIRARNTSGYEAPAGITAEPVVFALVEGELTVLLVRRIHEPYQGMWGLPGGFVGYGEAPEDTAQRKLTEKTAVGQIYLEQLKSYASPGRDPRGWIVAIAYLALIPAHNLHGHEADERVLRDAGKWWPVDSLPDLAFDHDAMIRDGVDRLRGKLWYSNIAVGLLPREFTMPEARHVFEEISGMQYEPSNFRRELIASGLVQRTGNRVLGKSGRPADCYEFMEATPSWSERRSRVPARKTRSART
ncbi:MAG: NUDIX hydrolase [Candidatus Dormibacteria bacterium]